MKCLPGTNGAGHYSGSEITIVLFAAARAMRIPANSPRKRGMLRNIFVRFNSLVLFSPQ